MHQRAKLSLCNGPREKAFDRKLTSIAFVVLAAHGVVDFYLITYRPACLVNRLPYRDSSYIALLCVCRRPL